MLQLHEWPAGTTEHMDSSLLDILINWRAEAGYPVRPSPLYDAHVRHVAGTSRHCTKDVAGNERKSDGTDFFAVHDFQADNIWLSLVAERRFGGIGIYFDTTPSTMFHVDMRQERVLWIRINKTEYIYHHNDPIRFWNELNNGFKKLNGERARW